MPAGSNYYFFAFENYINRRNFNKFYKSHNPINIHLYLNNPTIDCCLYFDETQMELLNKITNTLQLKVTKNDFNIDGIITQPYLTPI